MGVKTVFKRIITNRWVIICAATVGVYCLVGFFLLPYLAGRYLNNTVENKMGRELDLKKIRFNPFTFTMEAEGFALKEKNHSPLLAFDFFSADFGFWSSLYHRTWTFSQIKLSDPHLDLIVMPDGRSNLLDLVKDLPGRGKKEQTGETGSLPRILLEKLVLSNGEISFMDRRKIPQTEVDLRSVSIVLKDIGTLPERTGGYTLSAGTRSGEGLKWRGTVFLNPVRSKGFFEIGTVKAATLWDFLKERLDCKKPPGVISLAGEYIFELKEKGSIFTLKEVKIDASDLEVTLPDEQSPIIALEKVTGRGGAFQWQERSLSLDTLRLEGGVIRTEKNEAGVAQNWKRLIKKGSTESAVRPGEGENKEKSPRAEWSASLSTFTIKDFQVHLTDRTVEPPVEFILDPVDVSLAGLSTDPEATVAFDVHTRIEENGEISAKGKTRPWKRSAEGHIEINGFSLPSLQSYLNRSVRLTLESGSLNMSGAFGYGLGEDGKKFTYKGQGAIKSLHARTEEADKPFWGWDSLSCSDITLRLWPGVLELGDVSLIGPSGRLIIYEDRTVNLSQLLVRKKEGKEKQGPEKGFSFSVERIGMEQGFLEFADLSLKPQFGADIHDLKGSIAGISSIPGTTAKIELEGRVDEHGLSRIQGETDFFRPTGATDVTVDFRNIDMSTLTPYAVRFAGYRIASGKLSLDLHYTLRDGKMIGQNQIIADRLTLGERVESPTALNLPFELAIALLKDSKGVIDIGLPVTGDLRKPQFEFGEVIRKALSSLLKKIITAPFSWLAALVGSEKEDLGTVLFDPGKADLLPPEQEKLMDLSKALAKRPRLKLQIRGEYNPALDVPVLKDLLMRNRVASKRQQTLKPGEEPGPVVFHEPEAQKALEDLFLESNPVEELSKLRVDFRESLQPKERDLSGKAQAAVWAGFYKDLYHRLEEKLKIPESRLKELAEERAKAVQTFLVETKDVNPQRIELLDSSQTGKGDSKGVPSQLSLGTEGNS